MDEFYREHYDKNGNITTVEKEICAKKLVSNHTGNEIFYIKTSGKYLYNPTSSYITYTSTNWKFIKVPKQKFDLYLNFLKTKQQTLLIQAERLL